MAATPTQQDFIQEWIHENGSFHMDRYIMLLQAKKELENIPALREKEEKQAEDIKRNPQVFLNRLKKGKTAPCKSMNNKTEAYKHPLHNNEALYLSDNLEKVPHLMKDCYGDWYSYPTLEEALENFLSPCGHHQWIEALAYGHHNSRSIWVEKKKRSAPRGF